MRFSAATAVDARHIRIYALLFYGLGFRLIAVTQNNCVLAATLQRTRLLRFRVVRPLAIEWWLAGIIEPVETVQRGDLVALGQCRVIENRVYQRVDRSLKTYNGLSDVNEFCCAFANDMNTQ